VHVKIAQRITERNLFAVRPDPQQRNPYRSAIRDSPRNYVAEVARDAGHAACVIDKIAAGEA